MPKTSLNVRLEEESQREVKRVAEGLGIGLSDVMISAFYEFAKNEYEAAESFLQEVENGNIVSSEPGKLQPMIDEFERRKRIFKNAYDKYMTARAEGKRTIE
jgi:hypothetical protein